MSIESRGFDFENAEFVSGNGEVRSMPGKEIYDIAEVDRRIEQAEIRFQMAHSSYEESELRAELAELRAQRARLTNQ